MEPKNSPPITDRAKGAQISAPVPMPMASGIIEQIVVRAVSKIGRILLLQASITLLNKESEYSLFLV